MGQPDRRSLVVLHQPHACSSANATATVRLLYDPNAVRVATGSSEQGATRQQSRRIRVYPNSEQKQTINTWLTASRWTYNLSVEILQYGIPAVWKHIASIVMAEVKQLHPEWTVVPYQVKRTAVRDACRAMSNTKQFNQQLAEDHRVGTRLDEEFAKLGFRSRKNPRQSATSPTTPCSSTASTPRS